MWTQPPTHTHTCSYRFHGGMSVQYANELFDAKVAQRAHRFGQGLCLPAFTILDQAGTFTHGRKEPTVFVRECLGLSITPPLQLSNVMRLTIQENISSKRLIGGVG